MQLDEFRAMIAERRTLPPNFVRDVIMKAPSSDMMNNISRYILSMYTYDDKADDISIRLFYIVQRLWKAERN